MNDKHYTLITPDGNTLYVSYDFIQQKKEQLRELQEKQRKEKCLTDLCIIHDICSSHHIPMEINSALKFETKYTSDNELHDQHCRHYPSGDLRVENRDAIAIHTDRNGITNISVTLPKTKGSTKPKAPSISAPTVRISTVHSHQYKTSFNRCIQISLMKWYKSLSFCGFTFKTDALSSFWYYAKKYIKLNGQDFFSAVPAFSIFELTSITDDTHFKIVVPSSWSTTFRKTPAEYYSVSSNAMRKALIEFKASYTGLDIDTALINPYARVLVYGLIDKYHHFSDTGFGLILVSNSYLVSDSLFEAEFYTHMSSLLHSIPNARNFAIYKPWESCFEYRNTQKYLSDGIIYDRLLKRTIGVIEIFGMSSESYLAKKKIKENNCRYPLLTWDALNEPCYAAIRRLKDFLAAARQT